MIRLELPLPPSTNNLYQREMGFTRSGRAYRATRLKPKVEAYRWKVREAINNQLTADQVKCIPTHMAIRVLLRDDASKMDADNCLKATIDAIKGPLGFDDNKRRVRKVEAVYVTDRSVPVCVVEIEPFI